MKKPKRDRHSFGRPGKSPVAHSIAKSYEPKPVVPGKIGKTALVKAARKRKKP